MESQISKYGFPFLADSELPDVPKAWVKKSKAKPAPADAAAATEDPVFRDNQALARRMVDDLEGRVKALQKALRGKDPAALASIVSNNRQIAF